MSFDNCITDEQHQENINAYHQRLRDEFAMHANVGNLGSYTKLFKESVLGRKMPDSETDPIGCINFRADFEMTLRYLKADAAMKAREVQ